jgi:hypothetical protein
MDASHKRLLYYLLLNVIVSACVTSAVLFVYDRYSRPMSQPQAIASQPVSQTGGGTPNMEITAVVGAGIPGSETVILRNTGTGQADLKNWKLQDQDANIYTFADVILLPGSSMQLHTLPGQDTLIDLYWGLTASVWRSGETTTLFDPTGAVRSVFQVP